MIAQKIRHLALIFKTSIPQVRLIIFKKTIDNKIPHL